MLTFSCVVTPTMGEMQFCKSTVETVHLTGELAAVWCKGMLHGTPLWMPVNAELCNKLQTQRNCSIMLACAQIPEISCLLAKTPKVLHEGGSAETLTSVILPSGNFSRHFALLPSGNFYTTQKPRVETTIELPPAGHSYNPNILVMHNIFE